MPVIIFCIDLPIIPLSLSLPLSLSPSPSLSGIQWDHTWPSCTLGSSGSPRGLTKGIGRCWSLQTHPQDGQRDPLHVGDREPESDPAPDWCQRYLIQIPCCVPGQYSVIQILLYLYFKLKWCMYMLISGKSLEQSLRENQCKFYTLWQRHIDQWCIHTLSNQHFSYKTSACYAIHSHTHTCMVSLLWWDWDMARSQLTHGL